jgi:restriction system protein
MLFGRSDNNIYDFGLGMQVEQTIEIKKLDANFWDSLKDIEE